MAHVVLTDNKKEMRRVLVFDKMFVQALSKMKRGAVIRPTLARLDDGTLFVKEIND
jgi:hypothetical protein